MEYAPTLVIAFGHMASKICKDAQLLINRRFNIEKTPPIFRFLGFDGRKVKQENLFKAYHELLDPTSQNESARILGGRIESRVNIYFITPLDGNLDNCVKSAEYIRQLAVRVGVEGSFNGIFLTAQNLLGFQKTGVEKMVQSLDRHMTNGKNSLFNRCYFIDEINEDRFVLTEQASLIELIAVFLDLAIASQIGKEIKTQFPPYILKESSINPNTSPMPAYASLGCTLISCSSEKLHQYWAKYLAQDLWNSFNTLHHDKDSGSSDSLIEWLQNEVKSERVLSQKEFFSLDDIEEHLDYKLRKKEVMSLLLQILRMSNCQFNQLRHSLEKVLETWLICLEEYAAEISVKKSKLAEKIVDAKFDSLRYESLAANISEPAPVKKPVKSSKSVWNRIWEIYEWIVGSKENEAVSSKFAPIEKEVITRKRESDWKEQLEIQIEDYQQSSTKMNILIRLFIFLDMICINLDRFDLDFAQDEISHNGSTKRAFTADIINSSSAKNLYSSSEYKNMPEIAEKFIKTEALAIFVGNLGEYAGQTAKDTLIDFCRESSLFVRKFSKADILESIFINNTASFSLFSPFWNLKNRVPQKIAIIGYNSEISDRDREILFSKNSASERRICVFDHTQENIAVLQISYGANKREIFSFD